MFKRQKNVTTHIKINFFHILKVNKFENWCQQNIMEFLLRDDSKIITIQIFLYSMIDKTISKNCLFLITTIVGTLQRPWKKWGKKMAETDSRNPHGWKRKRGTFRTGNRLFWGGIEFSWMLKKLTISMNPCDSALNPRIGCEHTHQVHCYSPLSTIKIDSFFWISPQGLENSNTFSAHGPSPEPWFSITFQNESKILSEIN